MIFSKVITILFNIAFICALLFTAWAFTKAIFFGIIALMITAGLGWFCWYDYKKGLAAL